MAGVIAIIPARLGSTRFPAKVLASETGRPLIQHVYERAQAAVSVRRVVVATDDDSVLAAAKSFGAEAVMTSASHPNGTSRLAEACEILRLGDGEIVVNVQGDEPELEPRLIDEAVAALREAGPIVAVSTVAVPIDSERDAANPNIVKAVLRRDGTALYFSRARVPFDRDTAGAPALRHLGLYVYRRAFLREYLTLAPTPLEMAEKLEQLRVLEHGHAIAVAVCPWAKNPGGGGIDTKEQYEEFVARWKSRR